MVVHVATCTDRGPRLDLSKGDNRYDGLYTTWPGILPGFH